MGHADDAEHRVQRDDLALHDGQTDAVQGEDVAVAAFDDMEWAIFIQPALTMVAQPTYEIGRIAVELLQKRIRDPRRPPEEIILPARVITRSAPLPTHRAAGE